MDDLDNYLAEESRYADVPPDIAGTTYRKAAPKAQIRLAPTSTEATQKAAPTGTVSYGAPRQAATAKTASGIVFIPDVVPGTPPNTAIEASPITHVQAQPPPAQQTQDQPPPVGAEKDALYVQQQDQGGAPPPPAAPGVDTGGSSSSGGNGALVVGGSILALLLLWMFTQEKKRTPLSAYALPEGDDAETEEPDGPPS